LRCFVARGLGAELGVHEQFDAAPGQQNFIFVELHVIAHVDVEQVVAGEAGGDQGRSPRRILVESRVFDLQLEQVVAGGGSLVDAEVVLPENVQQAHAHEPVVGAPIGAAAHAHGRHAWDVAAIGGEGGAHEIVLAVDAENAGRQRHEIPLPGDLGAAEDGVALGVDGLDEIGTGAAGRESRAAENAGRLPEDEVVVVGVVDLGVEAEIALEPLQP
jgi:hypothetical protein